MRNTPQKRLIFEIVNNSNEHLTANEIYQISLKRIPNISLGTVYRDLNSLLEEKKITRLKMDDNTFRFDNNKNHAHFICRRCNSIIDIYDNVFDNIDIIDGNIVDDYEIKLKGICIKCQGGNDN